MGIGVSIKSTGEDLVHSVYDVHLVHQVHPCAGGAFAVDYRCIL